MERERRARGLGWPREKELFPPASNLVTRWKGGFPRLATTMHTEGRVENRANPPPLSRVFFFFPLLAREPTIFTPFEKYRWFRRDEGLGENAVTRPIPHGLPLDAAPLRLYASLLDDNYFIFRAREKEGLVGEWFLFRRIIFIPFPPFFYDFTCASLLSKYLR